MDFGNVIGNVFDIILVLIPFLLPIGLFYLLSTMLLNSSRQKFILEQEAVLLEVIPPIEISKSPAAMELFLTTVFKKGDAENPYDKYVKGKIRPWFSLELVSLEGVVHFFIWTFKDHKKTIESQLYAQFPGIEVKEVEDYMSGIDYHDGIELFGVELGLTKPDPYPIKTYMDYGIDKETKEDLKVDPITPILETLGSLGKGHMMCFQIIFRSHAKEDKDPTKFLSRKPIDAWIESARSEIKDIRDKAVIEFDDGEKKTKRPAMTKGESLKIEALERSVAKLSFDVGIRTMYIAEKNTFEGGNIGAMIGSFNQFNSPELNGFKLSYLSKTKYQWMDPSGKKTKLIKTQMLDAYKDRAYFWRKKKVYPVLLPSKYEHRQKFVLNTEELATIFHFPGRVSATPTVERVISKKATPPPNLPI